MKETLEILCACIAISTAVWAIFYKATIQPLELSIKALHALIEEIRLDMKAMRERREEINERLAIVESSAKQAHKRIDEIRETHRTVYGDV